MTTISAYDPNRTLAHLLNGKRTSPAVVDSVLKGNRAARESQQQKSYSGGTCIVAGSGTAIGAGPGAVAGAGAATCGWGLGC